MILSIAFWIFIAYFGIAVSIIVCFLVWDLTRIVTTDPNPSIWDLTRVVTTDPNPSICKIVLARILIM